LKSPAPRTTEYEMYLALRYLKDAASKKVF
jgi:hypothetical protein